MPCSPQYLNLKSVFSSRPSAATGRRVCCFMTSRNHPALPRRPWLSRACILLAVCAACLAPAHAQKWLPDEAALRAALAARPAPPRTFYVSPTGNDQHDGLAPARALRSPQRAADLTQPGDTVEFMEGAYPGSDTLLRITRSGTPEAYITYRAHPGQRPVFAATNGWDQIRIEASYLIVDGLVIEGSSRSISHEEALRNYESIANVPAGTEPDFQKIAYSNTNGISIDGRRLSKAGSPPPHHIVIRNCEVAYTPGGGIATNESDYILIERNIVHDCAHTMIYGGSGISVFHSRALDANMDDYKLIVRNNRVFRNETRVPWLEVGRISDGNGIIIDDLRNTQINTAPYTGRTLVANNVSYENGGSGIHAFSSDRVDIVNNTVYGNNRQLPWGNLFVGHGTDCLVLNNIIVSTPGGLINSNTANERVIYAHNLYFGGKPAVTGPGDRIADPLFVDLEARDFRLGPDSPAIDQGVVTRAPSVDLLLQSRPRGAGIDLGAYESDYTAAAPLANAELDVAAILKTFVFVPPFAEALRGTPVLDGIKDPVWNTTRPIAALNVMTGGDLRPTGARGVSYALWDEKNLYLLTEVTDAELSDAAKADYEKDSVEYFVDQNHARTSSLQDDDGQYRVNFKGEKSTGTKVKPEDYQAAATRTATGYIVEMLIPLKHIKPAVGVEIGLDVQINDGDAAGRRVSCVTWSAPDDSGYSSTSRYGRLLLTDRLREAVQNMDAPPAP